MCVHYIDEANKFTNAISFWLQAAEHRVLGDCGVEKNIARKTSALLFYPPFAVKLSQKILRLCFSYNGLFWPTHVYTV